MKRSKRDLPPAAAAQVRAGLGLMTYGEVAAALGLSIKSLGEARSRGGIDLPTIRAGKSPLFRRIDVELLLARSVEPARSWAVRTNAPRAQRRARERGAV